MPQADGSIAGDIHPSAQKIPQHITPVPGGIGPVEMAVLMDRIVRQEADPGRQLWTFSQMPYLNRGDVAALGSLSPASAAVSRGPTQTDTSRPTGSQQRGFTRDGGEPSR
jgi:methylenetetrahydrofolate dehydrogenase (NADP+)/methenyltetrahydrofolate cyclohydrolase